MPTLYIDMMSQPSRSCWILCKVHNLPVDIKFVRLDKGEHRQPEYLKLNPLGKVPVLVDGDLRLPESAAIMEYLCEIYNVPRSWCPLPTAAPHSTIASHLAKHRAAYLSAVHWQHLTVRAGCMRLVFHTVLGPRVFKVPASNTIARHGQQIMQQALKDLESYWLANSKKFMTGDYVCIADVLCCCEFEQLRVLVAAPSWPQYDQILAPYPKVKAWMQAVRQAVGPAVYDEAHSMLHKAVERLAAATAADGGVGSSGPSQSRL